MQAALAEDVHHVVATMLLAIHRFLAALHIGVRGLRASGMQATRAASAGHFFNQMFLA